MWFAFFSLFYLVIKISFHFFNMAPKKRVKNRSQKEEEKKKKAKKCSGAALRQLVKAASILDWLHIISSSMEVYLCG